MLFGSVYAAHDDRSRMYWPHIVTIASNGFLNYQSMQILVMWATETKPLEPFNLNENRVYFHLNSTFISHQDIVRYFHKKHECVNPDPPYYNIRVFVIPHYTLSQLFNRNRLDYKMSLKVIKKLLKKKQISTKRSFNYY